MTSSQDFESQRPMLAELCQRLKELKIDDPLELASTRVRLLGEHDVYKWFVPVDFGGFGWSPTQLVQGYLELSSACLSSAFVLTQRSGAVSRIASSPNEDLKADLLPKLAKGELFCTVGISHLTTSHRHLKQPALLAEKVQNGFQLKGFSPWVTGVSLADSVVVGASFADGTEALLHVRCDQSGVERPQTPQLVALSDSCTGEFRLNDVFVDKSQLVAGPAENIMTQGTGGSTGGLQTSTLAVGLARAAIEYIEEQTSIRGGYDLPAGHLRDQWDATFEYLMGVASKKDGHSNEQLRSQANSLVLRATQAALMIAKGAGYRDDHPVGRWCREALFFLVWSCPQPVAESNLCELAQIS